MKALLWWTAAELAVAGAAVAVWGARDVYEWRTHNPWIAVPALAFVTVMIVRRRRTR